MYVRQSLDDGIFKTMQAMKKETIPNAATYALVRLSTSKSTFHTH